MYNIILHHTLTCPNKSVFLNPSWKKKGGEKKTPQHVAEFHDMLMNEKKTIKEHLGNNTNRRKVRKYDKIIESYIERVLERWEGECLYLSIWVERERKSERLRRIRIGDV